MKLSVVIPARNEADSIRETVSATARTLRREDIDFEILVIDDGSVDDTRSVVLDLADNDPSIKYFASPNPPGFGFAVRFGLDNFEGDAVAIMMADGSDSPADLISYFRLLEAGYDCAFGSRFIRGANVHDYPKPKLVLNRAANLLIRALFRHGYNDTTNAFKAYRREVIETARPFLSNHFNLTVELPLKAIVRGHSYGVLPVSWTNRREGASKLRLQEMGSRYVFIVLYVLLEHHLSKGDYRTSAARAKSKKLRPGLPA